MPAQLLFCVEQLVGCCVFEFFPPLFYRAELRRVGWQELYEYIMFVAVVADFLRLVPSCIVHDDEKLRIFCVQSFQELEELSGVELVAEHVMALVVSLCTVAVEVLAHICELLHWPASFSEPASNNFWQNAEGCLIQNK